MTRLLIGVTHEHNDGISDRSILERLEASIASEELPLDYGTEIEPLCRTCGFSNTHIVRKVGKKKLTISGTFNDIGLMVWFGNQHFVFKHFLNLQLLFNEGNISSALFITSMKDETINRLGKIKKSQGKEPPKSATNYCEYETTVEFLEAIADIITIPITVVGLQAI